MQKRGRRWQLGIGCSLSKRQRLSDPKLVGLGPDGVAEGDIGDAQAAVPEQDRLGILLAPRAAAGDDLAELGTQVALMQAVLGSIARVFLRSPKSQGSILTNPRRIKAPDDILEILELAW